MRRQSSEGLLHAEELELYLAATKDGGAVAVVNAIVLQVRVQHPTSFLLEVSHILHDISGEEG